MTVRYALARKKAVELLQLGNVKKPEVPVEKLAALLNASIRYEPFAGELSGMVQRRSDGSAVIGVNSLHAATRKRFTIAHELGHLVLHKDEDIHIDERFPVGFRTERSSMAVDPKEIEANQFAAELLMPTRMLEADLAHYDLDIESARDVEALASRYKVSSHAMTIRLSRFGTSR